MNDQMESYLARILAKMKQDPKHELRQEFGRMLMRHINSFTPQELARYHELQQLLKDEN